MAEEKGMLSLVGKKMYKSIKFMGEDIRISKLSVAEVTTIQERAKGIEANEAEGFNVLRTVIRFAVENAETISDEDFDKFPMEELSKLSNEIMKFSGIGENAGK